MSKETRRAQSLAYYHRNKEKIAERRKAFAAAHPEKIRERNQIQYERHRVRILATKKRHREKFRSEYAERAKKKRLENPETGRAQNLRRVFGLTISEYERMLSEQGGVCEICGGVDADRRLAVDHCHKTGRIRALLCGGCNTAIGRLGDDPELLEKAAAYLRRHLV